jgi:Fe-S cluster assembly ATP-binding protein
MLLLEIKNLHVEIDGKKILKVVDLEVNAGEVHAIIPERIGRGGYSDASPLLKAQEFFR